MAEQHQKKETAAPTAAKYVVIAGRSDADGNPWNGYWWLGCHWPVGVHEVQVVAEGAAVLTAERKAYSDADKSSLYTREEADAHGEPELLGKFRPWRHLTAKELEAVSVEPKHCIKVVDNSRDPRIMVFPPDSSTAPKKSPADLIKERLAEARSQL